MGALTFPALDQAIAKFEGFGKPGVYATIDNNPGNLVASPLASGSNGPFATFDTAETGFQALDQLVTHYADSGATISSMMQAYAPPTAPGNSAASTNNYTNFLANMLGVTPETPVSDLANMIAPGSSSPSASAPGPAAIASLPATIDQALSSLLGFNSSGSTPSAFSWARVGAFLIGLAMLIVGLVALGGNKSPTNIVVNAGKSVAKKAVELAPVGE